MVKHFSDIPSNELSGDDFSMYTYRNTFQPKFHEMVYFIKPIGNVTKVELSWYLEPHVKVTQTDQEVCISVLNILQSLSDLQNEAVQLLGIYSG